MLELFRRLHADGQAILLVTHDNRVAATADRIVKMRDGRLDEDNTESVSRAPRVSYPTGLGPLPER